jgi:hypothetical protein
VAALRTGDAHQRLSGQLCCNRLCGPVQPEHAEWNRLGYGNNSIQKIAIRIGN